MPISTLRYASYPAAIIAECQLSCEISSTLVRAEASRSCRQGRQRRGHMRDRGSPRYWFCLFQGVKDKKKVLHLACFSCLLLPKSSRLLRLGDTNEKRTPRRQAGSASLKGLVRDILAMAGESERARAATPREIEKDFHSIARR